MTSFSFKKNFFYPIFFIFLLFILYFFASSNDLMANDKSFVGVNNALSNKKESIFEDIAKLFHHQEEHQKEDHLKINSNHKFFDFLSFKEMFKKPIINFCEFMVHKFLQILKDKYFFMSPIVNFSEPIIIHMVHVIIDFVL